MSSLVVGQIATTILTAIALMVMTWIAIWPGIVLLIVAAAVFIWTIHQDGGYVD